MAGRKKQAIDHAVVRDLPLTTYLKARDLVATGKTQAEVCRLCQISGPEYWHMWRNGFPARGGQGAQPSFEAYLSEHLVATRRAGQQAAETVGVRGVLVLSKQVENARLAQEIAEMVLQCQREKLAEWLAHPTPRPPIAEYMVGEEAERLLRTLHRWGDLTKPATAFDRLYNLNVGEHWSTRGDELPVVDASAKERMPAALSSREEVTGGDAGKTYQLVEAAKTFDGWTDEEVEAYITSGGAVEPVGKS
jgi:hypothetical protein